MKLTNDHRAQITHRALDAKFKNIDSRLKSIAVVLALDVYNYLYDPDIRAKMNTLPSEFFPQKSVVYVKTLGGMEEAIQLAQSFKISARDNCYWQPCLNFKAELDVTSPTGVVARSMLNELNNRIERYVRSVKEREVEYGNTRRTIKAFLTPINTDKVLADVWPEGIEFYKHLVKAKAAPVPMISTVEVNKVLKGILP
jgi:hypothetical protein